MLLPEAVTPSIENRFWSLAITPALPWGVFVPVKFWPSIGAGEGIRTLDPDLGKVVLYP